MGRLDDKIRDFAEAVARFPLNYRYNAEYADRMAGRAFDQAREDELRGRVTVPPNDEREASG
jgi:hypothetical protein